MRPPFSIIIRAFFQEASPEEHVASATDGAEVNGLTESAAAEVNPEIPEDAEVSPFSIEADRPLQEDGVVETVLAELSEGTEDTASWICVPKFQSALVSSWVSGHVERTSFRLKPDCLSDHDAQVRMNAWYSQCRHIPLPEERYSTQHYTITYKQILARYSQSPPDIS